MVMRMCANDRFEVFPCLLRTMERSLYRSAIELRRLALFHCVAKRKPMMLVVKGLKISMLLAGSKERASCDR